MNTYEIILNAAFQLMEQKPFKQLTIQEILDQAHVSRSTFYRHFKDKYEIMHLYYKTYMDREIIANFNGKNLAELTVECYVFAEERAKFFTNIKDVEGQNSFWDFLYTYIYDTYRNNLLHNLNGSPITEEEKVLLEFATAGTVGIYKKYTAGRMRTLSPKQIAQIICSHVPERLITYID